MKILVTGSAGFIGFHLCKKLLNNKKYEVHGLDNLNNYYDLKLKKNRLKILNNHVNFIFFKIDLTNKKKLDNLLIKNKYKIVINLAAQAGVRYSIKYPREYLNSNIIGFYNLIETCIKIKVSHFVFASTSSVYGLSNRFPTKENHNTDTPLSFYAASKKNNETIAHSLSYIYKLPVTGLRFFTVYGPYGRPDMSLFKFTKNILDEKQIELYNNGNHFRDFTYVDDVAEVISKIINKKPKGKIPYNIFNVGSGNEIHLKKFIRLIEKNLNKKGKIKFIEKQIGDVYKTKASKYKLFKHINYYPKTKLEYGVKKFISWFKEYYGV